MPVRRIPRGCASLRTESPIRPIRLPLLAAIVVLLIILGATLASIADAKVWQRPMRGHSFVERHYPGCQTWKCVYRVRAKLRAKSSPRAIGRRMSYRHGQPWRCVDQLIHRESGWRVTVANASSGAYGLPQALPGHKMASKGRDWRTSARTQLAWFFSYVKGRYGGACAALAHSHARGWY